MADTTPDTTEAPKASAPEPVDDLVTTEHSIKIGRTKLEYTAAAGRIVLKEEVFDDGVAKGYQPKAEVFITAYTAKDAGSDRPVTFAFNGGPGSSSIWLHMGLLGPRRVVSGDADSPARPPYEIVDNAETLLAVSDVVFIDPMSTGYTRTVDDGKPGEFHGFTADIESVGEVIRLWTTRNDRWLSPKFVAGESYGTIRASALAQHLQTKHGMYLNGIMLISSVLDMGSLGLKGLTDRAAINFLPTYAATAWYHGKHGRKQLATVINEAEEYAATVYPYVLARGNRLPDDERAEAVETISRLTGISADYVDRANLRLEHIRFFTELLRDQGKSTGRLDTRFTGPLAAGNAERWDADPAMDATMGPYATAWNHYVRSELSYRHDMPYAIFAGDALQKWSYKEFEGVDVQVVDRLARAMRQNPALQVHVAYGYFDGATPHFAAEDVFAHLDIDDDLRDNIEHKYYEAGHMMYVHEPSRIKQGKDLRTFVERAAGS